MPADAVLSGLLLLVSFCLSHCTVAVPGTTWIEPVILWITIGMQTGSGKTPLHSFLIEVLRKVRAKHQPKSSGHPWILDHASFEKMGEIMSINESRLLGCYDQLSTFLAQMNVYRVKGIAESHEFSTFLSLYKGKGWSCVTGEHTAMLQVPWGKILPKHDCAVLPKLLADQTLGSHMLRS